MRKRLHVFAIIVLALSAGISCYYFGGQPFEDEIRAFRKADQEAFPPAGAILFVGSSSFRLWKDMQQDFPEHTVINRGFGGARLKDLICYAPDIIFPYNPRQIVVYCGENDAAEGNITAAGLTTRFRKFFELVREKLPYVPIVFVSMKPSPSREHIRPLLEEANRQIREYLDSQDNALYLDVYTPMLGEDGKPRPELFVDDRLHMSEAGYEIWKSAIGEVLLE